MFLHIIAFDIPYPANYGGIIVIYNQIKALHACGVKVILHCFQYDGKEPQDKLAEYCHEVYYYPRNRSLFQQFGLTPFIMRTRTNRKLLRRLKEDEHPILFEGLHTASYITNRKLRHRKKILRMHNVEWKYYESLFELEDSNVPKKLYYFIESLKLQRIEPKVVLHADKLLTVSTNDQAYFQKMTSASHFIPVFHPNTEVESQLGKGDYVMFHGKLSVPDNERSAIWLIKEVFSHFDIPFVLAGLDPTKRLKDLVARYEHISLVENPEEQDMVNLIRKAQINLLFSFQNAGMKLKLLNALFRGRFCIVNENMVSGTGLHRFCYVRNSSAALRQTVEALYNAPFTLNHVEKRRELMEHDYSNIENARKLIDLIWEKEAEGEKVMELA